MILPVIWYYIAGCQSFKSKNLALSFGYQINVQVLAHSVAILMIVKWHSISREFFPCAPKLFHVMFHQIMSPSCAPYKRVSLKSALGSSGNEKSQSVTSNLNIPTSPRLGHLWFLKVPIPPLPQLIERTHAQITQPHEILNIIPGTIGAISVWFDLSNCQSLTKSRTFPSSQSFPNPSPYK